MSLRVDDGVRAGHRVLLTGTPVQNNLTELITLLRLVMPDLFLIQEDGKLKDDEDVGWDEAEGTSLRIPCLPAPPVRPMLTDTFCSCPLQYHAKDRGQCS